MVGGPGGRHVEEAAGLGLVGLLLQGGPLVVATGPHRGVDLHLGPVMPPQDHGGPGGRPRPVEPGEEDHGELQALRGVDGHDAHGVVVGLRQDHLDGLHPLLLLEGGPRQEAVQIPAVVVGELPGLVGHEAEPPPGVPGPTVVEGQFHHPSPVDDLLDQPAHVEPAATSVQLPQHAHGLHHRVVAAGRRRRHGQVVPGPPGRGVPDQVVVPAAERRGPERGHQVHLVGRVVDRPQDGQELLDLVGGEDQRARLEAVGDAGPVEGVEEQGQARAGRDEHGLVPVPGRMFASRRAHGPALVADPPHGGGQLPGLGDPDHVDPRGLPVGAGSHRPAQEHHGRHRRVVGRQGGVESLVRRLQPRSSRSDQFGEDPVDPVDDRGDRAEVDAQREAVPGEAVPHPEEEPHVGPAEAVDGLLGVADEEEPAPLDVQLLPRHRPVPRARRSAGDADGQLGLDGVGVLELVDQQALVLAAEQFPGRRDVAHHLAGQHEEVVELQPAFGAPSRCTVERQPLQGRQDLGQRRLGHRGHDPGPRRLGVLQLRPDVGHRARPIPLGAPATGQPGGTDQQLEDGPLVGRRPELVPEPGQRPDVADQLVATGDRAPVGHPRGAVEVVQYRRTVDHRRRSAHDLVVDQQVPVAVERLGHRSQVVGLHPAGQQTGQRRLGAGVGQQPVEEPVPPFVEVDGRLTGVEHVEDRRETRFERVGGQDPPGEPVQRGDRRPVDGPEGLAGPLGPDGVDLPRPGHVLETHGDPVAELGRRRLGEGDGRQVLQVAPAARDELDDAPDQGRGLPRPRPGLDEEVPVQVLGDRPARRLVDGRFRHDASAGPAPGSPSARAT